MSIITKTTTHAVIVTRSNATHNAHTILAHAKLPFPRNDTSSVAVTGSSRSSAVSPTAVTDTIAAAAAAKHLTKTTPFSMPQTVSTTVISLAALLGGVFAHGMNLLPVSYKKIISAAPNAHTMLAHVKLTFPRHDTSSVAVAGSFRSSAVSPTAVTDTIAAATAANPLTKTTPLSKPHPVSTTAISLATLPGGVFAHGMTLLPVSYKKLSSAAPTHVSNALTVFPTAATTVAVTASDALHMFWSRVARQRNGDGPTLPFTWWPASVLLPQLAAR